MAAARSIIRHGLLVAVSIATLTLIGRSQAAESKPAPGFEERFAKTRTDLKSDDVKVRRAAIGSLVHSDLSPKMLAEMQQTLKDSDGDIRSVAATAIGNLGSAATAAVPDLIAQLKKDPVKEARETAARALGRIGKAASDEKRPIAPLQQAGKEDADPVTQVVALGALAMMQVDEPGQITAIRTFLHHDEPLVRMKAAHALGGIGRPAREAAAEIVKVLETEPDGHRRGYVARAVGNVGNPAFLPALLAAYAKETDSNAKGEMRGAISKLGGTVPKP